jgi:hypothetical protein
MALDESYFQSAKMLNKSSKEAMSPFAKFYRTLEETQILAAKMRKSSSMEAR